MELEGRGQQQLAFFSLKQNQPRPKQTKQPQLKDTTEERRDTEV